ncbi:transporter substrate-binding domain-containing protein [Leeia sp. TBRC 13508]|uniref:Transporter substrate-binding domain-containing protein n=1 Tax=Leeia speluncae TaxID=2884804 RepID=A0ABS8DB24_9NEIS|nr:transporter substrate-binding domain-containing protein [Leeia speluncae]MCB6185423.1 transporter substrate-binding domain-containing protein [Leeia speluncae]
MLKKMSVVIALTFSFTQHAFAEDVIKIGTLSDYAPFEYKDPSGKLQGMEIELGDAMCKQMKAKCQYVTMDFDALIPALKAKKIDAVLAQMSITDERKKVVDFTNLFTLAPVQYVAKRNAGITENPATLKGKIVGVQSGTNHELYLQTRLPQSKSGIQVKVYQALDQAYLDLVAGRVNAVLADTTVSYDWIAKTGKHDGFDYAGKAINDVAMFGEGTGIAVRKGDPLKAKFNTAIQQVLADGTFAKANKKVFPFSIAPTK